MILTPIGLVFVALFAVGLVRGRVSFVWVIAVSLFFQDSAMFIVGGIGLTPYTVALVVALALQVGALVRLRVTDGQNLRFPNPLQSESVPGRWLRRALLIVLVYSVAISVIGPFLFQGLQIMPSQGASDYLVDRLPRLNYTLSNTAQIVYLLLNVGLVWFIATLPRVPRAVFLVALTVAAATLLVALVLAVVNAPFPHAFFDNSPRNYYSIQAWEPRFRGHFAEPSHLALFLCGALAYAFRQLPERARGQRALSVGLIVVCSLAFLSNRSTTIVLTAAVLAPIAAVAIAVRYRRRLMERRTLLLVVATGVAVGAVIVVLWNPIWDFLGPTLVGRIGSASQYSRGKQDINALSLFAQTFGVGVGLGSNRSSSLFAMLLSDIGLVGTAAYYTVIVLAVVVLFRRGAKAEAWALTAFATACAISVADFVSPPTWLLIGLAVHLTRPDSTSPVSSGALHPRHRALASGSKTPTQTATEATGDDRLKVGSNVLAPVGGDRGRWSSTHLALRAQNSAH